MKYILMHKDVSVAKLELDETTGSIVKVDSIEREDHLPVGVLTTRGAFERAALNEWWIDRSIPASRSGIRCALEVLDIPSTKMLLSKCFGLSLSDQYWIKPQESAVTWQEINFFDHPFSEDIGDVLLGKSVKTEHFNFRSPDNTSDGCLKKRWKIIDGKRCLIKAGSNPYMQQPFNEVIASRIMDRLGIPHVPYTLLWDDEKPYSVCEDFITIDTELVGAWRVMKTKKKDSSTSVYRHYLNCCEEFGIKDIMHSVDQMIVLDYIIANEDRHQNNFGLIRNANTLQWIGAAPIFDSGSSLGYDKLSGQIISGRNIECKPFKKSHEEQIKLVSSFDWIEFEKLKDLAEEMTAIFDQAGENLEDSRKQAVVDSVTERIAGLEALALSKQQTEDNIESDVEENISQSYELL